jgi:hypothetical protein
MSDFGSDGWGFESLLGHVFKPLKTLLLGV